VVLALRIYRSRGQGLQTIGCTISDHVPGKSRDPKTEEETKGDVDVICCNEDPVFLALEVRSFYRNK
jgi:hypothetical protein